MSTAASTQSGCSVLINERATILGRKMHTAQTKEDEECHLDGMRLNQTQEKSHTVERFWGE